MGYYDINNLIKERINNMFEAIKQIQTISLKQMDCINKNADNLNKLAEFLKDMQDNQNAMAKKILDLDTEIASLQKRLEKYERPIN
jgi:RNase adaptor protein for sRNA GlmZ degradation